MNEIIAMNLNAKILSLINLGMNLLKSEMKYLVSAVLFLFIFQGCLDNPFKQKVKPSPAKGEPLTGTTFTSEKIGWKIELPKGKEWRIITTKEHDSLEKGGRKVIEETTGVELPKSQTENLISFRKDQFNSFISSIEPFDESVNGNYDKMLGLLHEVIKNSYAAKNIPAEYEMSATRIDGIMVDRYDIKIYAAKKVILYQYVFTCFIKDHLLSIQITTNNEADRETLEKIVLSSDFY